MSSAKLQPSYRRPLRPAEQRLLRARLRNVEKNQHTVTTRSKFATPVVCGVLWLLTIWLSDVSLVVITIFWLVVGMALHVMVQRDTSGGSSWESLIDGALRANEVEIYEVRATAFLAYEPSDDEGARYMFQLESNRMLFVDGEVFIPGARFPSCDFNIVHALGADGRTCAEWTEKRGSRTGAAGTVRVPMREFPGHLEIVEGSLAEIAQQS